MACHYAPSPYPIPQLTTYFFPLSGVSLPLRQEAARYGDVSQGPSIPTTPRPVPSASREAAAAAEHHWNAPRTKLNSEYFDKILAIDVFAGEVTWTWTCEPALFSFSKEHPAVKNNPGTSSCLIYDCAQNYVSLLLLHSDVWVLLCSLTPVGESWSNMQLIEA